MLAELHNPARFRAELERLHARRDARRLWAATQDGVPLARLIRDKSTVARRLARDIASGVYQPSPATVRHVVLDKERLLYRFGAVDLVVHGVVAGLLVEAMEPRLSPHLYSYRRGRSPWQALARCADYVRAHRRRHLSPRDRGLYVVRADVAAYGDSIPFHTGSPVWDQLAELLDVDEAARASDDWRLVTQVVRVEVDAEPGAWTTSVGVPTGSPVATALANLYLDPLDQVLGDDPELLYARYGDDIIIAHEQRDTVEAAAARAREVLANRGLHFNGAKYRFCFFNGAGRPDASGDLPGADHVDYLGIRLAFDGTLRLTRSKQREVLRELRGRVGRAASVLADVDAEDRGRALCAAVRQCLDPRSPVAIRHAGTLVGAVTDRDQLRQLDYWIARAVAEAATGKRGVRAFRRVPYRQLRGWGLPSLVVRRNRGDS